jgi:hypothetical protein
VTTGSGTAQRIPRTAARARWTRDAAPVPGLSLTGPRTGGGSHRRGETIPSISTEDAIAGIPETLRQELFERYGDIITNYRTRNWEGASLNAAKFVETVYTILRGRASGAYPARAEKPKDMIQACRALETEDEGKMGGRGLRILIPRALLPIYEIRNNRGVGHAGAEIDPAHMDAEYALHSCQFILAELVRVYHQLPAPTARAVVDALLEREIPLIWEVGGVRRVLDATMEATDRVLVLLYASVGAIDEDELLLWTEYANAARFRNQILPGLHARALIHYDRDARTVVISPVGIHDVEQRLIPARPLTS